MSKQTIWYFYPTHHTVSFTLIAKKHIEILKKEYYVQEVPEISFYIIQPFTSPIVILHPFFYLTFQDVDKFPGQKLKYDKMIAVDVADSNHISKKAVELINMCDGAIVNSTWSREAYVNSGVYINVDVFPHGVDDEFFIPPREPNNNNLKFLQDLKKQKKLYYVLFFLWHSGWRKGADLVYQSMKIVQEKRNNIILITKISTIIDNMLEYLNRLKSFTLQGWMDTQTLIDLYDLADIVFMPSRGGSFELNGLEALARGKILLAPEHGAWLDYIPEFIRKYSLITTEKWVQPLPGNKIHDGLGAEISVEDGARKIIEAIDHIEEYKEHYKKAQEYIYNNFRWKTLEKKLIEIIKKYTY